MSQDPTPSAEATLAELVAERPSRATVLDRLGLDYCCHGDRTLARACAEAGLGVAEVSDALGALAPTPPGDWEGLDPARLSEHIEQVHHTFLHEELGPVAALAAKVLAVHGARHPELAEVARLVAELRADLEPHLAREEQVLFPAIRALAGGRTTFAFGSVRNPIAMMRVEHDRAGELLAGLRSATGGFAVPDDGCASYRALYERLEALEADTHLHVYKENWALFPAAEALEAAAGR